MQHTPHHSESTLPPVIFSKGTAVTILLAIYSGAAVSILADSGIALTKPAAVALAIGSVVALVAMLLSDHLWRSSAVSTAREDRTSTSQSIGDISELIEVAPTAISVIELRGNELVHLYDNQAANRLFTLSPEVRSSSATSSSGTAPLNAILLERCRDSKARAAPIRFEFQAYQAGQPDWYTAAVFPIRSTLQHQEQFACFIENITPHKENEIALREARDRLAAALEAGALATWDWDVQRDIVYGDSVLVNLYGLPKEYLLGAPVSKFHEHIHPDDRERVQRATRSSLELGIVFSEQYRVTDRHGNTRWLSATGRVLHDAAGKPARLPGVAVDITHLKEVEEQLHRATVASQNQLSELESIYTYAPVGLAVIDSNHCWLRVNKVMADYFAKAPSDFLGKSIHEVVPTVADGLERHLRTVIETKKPVLNIEVSGECPITAGSIRTWSTNVYPLAQADGTIVGINVVTEDITEDRRSTEEHRAHRTILNMATLEEPLETMLNALTDAVERIFPGATCYILHNHQGGAPVTIPPQASDPLLSKLFSPSPSAADLKPIFDVITKREETLLPDLQRSADQHYFARALQAGLRSCWIKPIILSDGLAWGACIIHHATINQNPTQAERDHLDVLLQLAVTVIERRAFFDRLTTTTERLQHAEKAGRIGVFDWNTQTGHLVWTPQLEISFGLEPGTFEGCFDAWKKRVHPDDITSVTDHIAQLQAERQTSFKYEYRIVLPNGELRWISAQGEFSYNEAGQPLRMIGVAIDITARKQLEEQGRRDQERLQLALEAGNLGLWDWHIPSGTVQFGGNWASMLGYATSEIEQHVRAWEVLIHPDDKPEVERRLKRHLAGKTPVQEVEHRLRTKSGSWLWVLARGRVVERDASGTPIRAVGIHADIHEQRMIRERLNSEAKRKDEFIATLAHELRNPLAPLRTGLEIIRRDPSGEAAAKAREMMNRQLIHMVRLIEDLLDISRISLGRLELHIERVPLHMVIEAALESSRPAIDAAQHEVFLNLPEEELFVQGDSARLSQVVGNLLVNAAKYTPLNGKITVEASAQERQITIKIRDTGVGIPQNKLTEIFEMFSQVQSPLDRTQGGLGIGLALVRRLVQMHGGVVYAESPGLGMGSTFTLRLPEG
jgi:PAS domain S-box-containing protein